MPQVQAEARAPLTVASPPKPALAIAPVLALFFVSGVPALIYQLAWQRSLFAIYGTNIESTTLVVAAFMLGLGLGSLAGGYLSRLALSHLAVFGLAELGTATFGLFSLRLFHHVAVLTTSVSTLAAGAIAFALLLVPTMLMGSTLPLLLRHLVARIPNTGRSVGLLYFANTLGSAIGCLLTAKVLMASLGQTRSVGLAAALNAGVGCCALLFSFLANAKTRAPVEARAPAESLPALPIGLGALIAGASGFLALGYEIVWYRIFSFTSGTNPRTLAVMLGGYLTGLAYGGLMADKVCRKTTSVDRSALLYRIAFALTAGSLLAFAVGPALAMALTRYEYSIAFVSALMLLGVTTALLGMILPLIAHVSVPPDQEAGGQLSYIYLANIVGSTLGSLLVGFWLMDRLPLRQLCPALAVAGIVLGAGLALSSGARFRFAVGLALMATLAIVLSSGPLYRSLYEKLLFKQYFAAGYRFADLIENRSGVITVGPDGTIWGGGAYDGKFNTSLVHDTNGIFRPFALSLFHPDPREVLVIGVSGGSWTKVLLAHPQVQHVTAIEIDPGYFGLIASHPLVEDVLHDPKVELVVADGRRWLIQHPERKFDAIVMNTTLHWRAHSTNLLSVEFLELMRSHLKPAGVAFYNASYSDEALYTGAAVFPYSLRVHSFIAVSDQPLAIDPARWKQILLQYRLDGRPVLDLQSAEARDRLAQLLYAAENMNPADPTGFEPGESIRHRLRGTRLVTDDNMATEWTR